MYIKQGGARGGGGGGGGGGWGAEGRWFCEIKAAASCLFSYSCCAVPVLFHTCSSRHVSLARKRPLLEGLHNSFPKSQFPNPKANRNLGFGICSDHENFSNGKLLWSERIMQNRNLVVRANHLQISALSAVVGYFHRISWIWDLGFGI